MEALHLPLPVNLLLIGFAGDGHANVTLSESELRVWIEGMEPTLAHSRRGEASASASGGGGLFEGESYVSYNCTIHAVELGASVTATFERAVAALARPADPASAEQALRSTSARFAPDHWYHVDAAQVSALLASLIAHVGLDAHAYNLVLLNLRKDALPPRYGYRAGFSAAEVALLRAEWDVHNMESVVRAQAGSPASPSLFGLAATAGAPASPTSRRWRPPRPASGFSFSARVWEADSWATSMTQALSDVASFRASLSPSAVLRAEAIATLNGRDEAAARALRRQLLHDVPVAASDCLTDTYVAPTRLAWADLSAGPLGWGPSASSAGLRRGALVDSILLSTDSRAAQGQPSDAAMQIVLEDLSAERYTSESDGFADEVSMLETELDVYEAFALKHCAGVALQPSICAELRERVSSLEVQLNDAMDGAASDTLLAEEEGEEATKPRERKPRTHGWALFEGDAAVGAQLSQTRARFLTELAHLLQSATRHVAAPVVSPGAYRHHDTVRVTLYDVLWSGGGGGGGGEEAGGRGAAAARRPRVDAEVLREAAAALLLPGQSLQLTVQLLSSEEDPAMAAALAASARSAATGEPLPPGDPSTHTPSPSSSAPGAHRYLDAWELHRQLSAVTERGRGRGAASGRGASTSDAGTAKGRPTLEVPLFVVTVLSGPPLYLDAAGERTHASLGDLALAVASPHPAAVAAQGMRCSAREGLLRRDLSDPVPAAVRALAAHLGGALPAAQGAHPADDDHTWATGAHALSSTAGSGAGGGAQLVADVVHRSYVVTALDASLDEANAGIAALTGVPTASSWAAYAGAPAAAATGRVLAHWAALVDAWSHVASTAALLDYGAAVQQCDAAESAAARFRHAAQELAAHLQPSHCSAAASRQGHALAARIDMTSGAWHVLVPSVLAVCAAAFTCVSLLRPRRTRKPKLN